MGLGDVHSASGARDAGPVTAPSHIHMSTLASRTNTSAHTHTHTHTHRPPPSTPTPTHPHTPPPSTPTHTPPPPIPGPTHLHGLHHSEHTPKLRALPCTHHHCLATPPNHIGPHVADVGLLGGGALGRGGDNCGGLLCRNGLTRKTGLVNLKVCCLATKKLIGHQDKHEINVFFNSRYQPLTLGGVY